MKKFGARMGYIIGLTLTIPLLIFIVNTFFLKGNNLSEEVIDQYIRNSDTIVVDVPKNAEYTNEQFTPRLHRGSSSAFFKKFTFYSNVYKKYFNLITFNYLEKNDDVRLDTFMFKNVTISARVNKEQLASPEYGTEQNPVPIFPKNLLTGHDDDKKFFHLSDQMYRTYVTLYLNRFTSEEAIKKLFPNEKK